MRRLAIQLMLRTVHEKHEKALGSTDALNAWSTKRSYGFGLTYPRHTSFVSK